MHIPVLVTEEEDAAMDVQSMHPEVRARDLQKKKTSGLVNPRAGDVTQSILCLGKAEKLVAILRK